MEMCRVSLYLAYAMAIYCLASLYYLVRTRSIGTPFNDSLTPKQIAIKDKSAEISFSKGSRGDSSLWW